jgi:hypothetical protein
LQAQVVRCEGRENLAFRRLRGLRYDWGVIENNSQTVLIVDYGFLETFGGASQEPLNVFYLGVSRRARLRIAMWMWTNLEILTTAELSNTRLRSLDLDHLWRRRGHNPRRGHFVHVEKSELLEGKRSNFVV